MYIIIIVLVWCLHFAHTSSRSIKVIDINRIFMNNWMNIVPLKMSRESSSTLKGFQIAYLKIWKNHEFPLGYFHLLVVLWKFMASIRDIFIFSLISVDGLLSAISLNSANIDRKWCVHASKYNPTASTRDTVGMLTSRYMMPKINWTQNVEAYPMNVFSLNGRLCGNESVITTNLWNWLPCHVWIYLNLCGIYKLAGSTYPFRTK